MGKKKKVSTKYLQHIAELFGSPKASRAALDNLGQMYIANSGDNDLEKIVHELEVPESRDNEKLIKFSDQLEDHIMNDYTACRVVLVDGWVLSVTEAKLCALLSLLWRKGP
jgi:hypothetical protein